MGLTNTTHLIRHWTISVGCIQIWNNCNSIYIIAISRHLVTENGASLCLKFSHFAVVDQRKVTQVLFFCEIIILKSFIYLEIFQQVIKGCPNIEELHIDLKLYYKEPMAIEYFSEFRFKHLKRLSIKWSQKDIIPSHGFYLTQVNIKPLFIFSKLSMNLSF